MVKICVLHPDLGIGGAERLIVDICVGLKSKHHDLDLYTNYHDDKRCFDETRNGQLNIIVKCSWFPRHVFGRFYALCAYIRMILLSLYIVYFSSSTYDIYICDQISACIPILKQSQKPVLFYCHYPDQLLTKRQTLLKKLYRYVIDYLEAYTTSLADKTLVNSQYTRDIFQQTFGKRIDISTVDILYPTINEINLKDQIIDNSLVNNIPPNVKTLFLSINRYERKKDLQLAIQAMAHLQSLLTDEQWQQTHLFVIGGYDRRITENVEYYLELDRLVHDLSLESNVTFVQSFTDQKKLVYLNRCKCVLYTPQYEHFGIVPLEAMYAERPCIATNTGGPLETILDGKTGYLCKATKEQFAEKMKLFVNQPHLYLELGKQGRRHVIGNFGFQIFSQKLHDFVQELLERRKETTTKNSRRFMIVLFGAVIFGYLFLIKYIHT